MATIKKGILGGVSGKVGNVVGANWKGIDYLRIKPANFTNANTEPQVSQRMKFAVVLKFLQPINELLRIGFKSYAIRMSAFNAAFSYNYHEALTGEFPNYSLDYAKVLFSRGNLPGAIDPGCTSNEPGKLKFTWLNNSGSNAASETDAAVVLIFNPESYQAYYLLQAAARADGEAVITVPADFSGKMVHCYLSFMSIGSALSGQVKNSVSNSNYIGSVTVA